MDSLPSCYGFTVVSCVSRVAASFPLRYRRLERPLRWVPNRCPGEV